MFSSNRAIQALLVVSVLALAPVAAEETAAEKHGLELSPQLMDLLRAEMQALLGGVQKLSAGIASGDWAAVSTTSAEISASYILARKLTHEQRRELDHALPDYFKRLDAAFHEEAEKLEKAANHHNAQLAAFHYYRLIEACTVCHANYAVGKFPGFSPAHRGGHAH